MHYIPTSKRKWELYLIKWPCPDGFHIPFQQEFSYMVWPLQNLGIHNYDWWSKYLRMPIVWYRKPSSPSVVTDRVYNTYYWCIDPNWNGYHAASLNLNARSVSIKFISLYIWHWCSIRPFKDEYVEPDDSWTVVAWTAWGNWLFWNQELWLFSLKYDDRKFTLADKNLWATEVWTRWSADTPENCWYLFQRWNNYWFPSFGSLEKISTEVVDASDYWPKNPYSSDTFIQNNVWNNPVNTNLWWWNYYKNKYLIK